MEGTVTGRGLMRVTYHQFWLLDERQQVRSSILATNGLFGTGVGAAMICTGIHTGVVRLSIEARDSAPVSIDVDGWDEVAEVSIEAPGGHLRAAALGSDTDPFPELTSAGPGEYRVRVHARGRDVLVDGVATEPVEDYHVTVWPQAGAEERIYKQTDGYGAQLRASVARAPVARERPVDEQQARVDEFLRQIRERYLGGTS